MDGGWMDGWWMDGWWMDVFMDGLLGRWIEGWLVGWIDRWMNECVTMDGRLKGWTHRLTNNFSRNISPLCIKKPHYPANISTITAVNFL